jgi:hypothetical protein
MWHCGAADAAQSAPSLLLPLRAEQGACTGGWRAQPARAAWQRWHGRTASTQAATRATESTGSNGALLVASRCERPASPPPLAGSHPRRTGGTPCGRAASAMSQNVSMSVQGEAGQPSGVLRVVFCTPSGARSAGAPERCLQHFSARRAVSGSPYAFPTSVARILRIAGALAARGLARKRTVNGHIQSSVRCARRVALCAGPQCCVPVCPSADAGCCQARPDSRPP